MDNPTLVITGTAGDIGRALSLAGAEQGYRVVGLDVLDERGNETAELVRAAGGHADYLHCDISDTEQLAAMFDEITATGEIAGLVNNAALGSHTAPTEITSTEWHRVLGVTLTGAAFSAQRAARSMIRSGRGGSIVTIASIAGLAALGRGNFAYSVAKAGLVGMTRELAVEWARSGIRVNAVAPSQVDTSGFRPLVGAADVAGGNVLDSAIRGIPLGRLATVDDITPLVMFLLGPASSFITGVTIPVDGGSMALHPGGTIGEKTL